MKFVALLLCLLITQPVLVFTQEKIIPTLDEFTVPATAEQFLLLLDQGNYPACGVKTSSLFQEKTVRD